MHSAFLLNAIAKYFVFGNYHNVRYCSIYLKEVEKIMEGRVEVEYLKNGKIMQELVQDWIDENSNILYCLLQEKALELEHR